MAHITCAERLPNILRALAEPGVQIISEIHLNGKKTNWWSSLLKLMDSGGKLIIGERERMSEDDILTSRPETLSSSINFESFPFPLHSHHSWACVRAMASRLKL